MIEREGESLDMRKAEPDPVEESQNFFAIPALNNLALSSGSNDKSDLEVKRSRLADAGLYGDTLKAGRATPPPAPLLLRGFERGVPTDLKGWASWLREVNPVAPLETAQPARDVLSALSRNDALVGELAQGLSRPESQWTPAWKTRTLPDNPLSLALPNYSVTQSLTPMLCLRSAAAARAGDAGAAHLSLLIAVRLTQAYMREPFFIGTLVACGQSAGINGAVWELCDAQSGTADQFRALQDSLTKLDYRQGLLCAERGEMAGAVNTLAYLNRTRDPRILEMISSLKTDNAGGGSSNMGLTPDELFEENEATTADWYFNYLLKPLRDAGLMQMLESGKNLNSMVDSFKKEPSRHIDSSLAQLWVPSVVGVIYKVFYTQAIENQAIAACALERYRIEHGKYPDTLADANHPGEKPIPQDIISGKPMGYRKTPDGRYLIWCVGFSGVDHGGTRMLDAQNSKYLQPSSPTYQGDWVWSYSPN
jgi:hypothetical protein